MARLPSYPAEIDGISRWLIASQKRRVSYDDRPSVGVEVVELWRGGETGRRGDGRVQCAFACEVLAEESAHLRLDLC